MLDGIMDLYLLVQGKLIATSITPQYTFSLHDIANVIDGLLIMSPRSKVKSRSQSKADSSTTPLNGCKLD